MSAFDATRAWMLAVLGALVLSSWASASRAESIVERYDRAARFGAWNAGRFLRNADLRPRWSRDGRALAYLLQRVDGTDLVVRRAADGRILHTVDLARLQASLPDRAEDVVTALARSAELAGDGSFLDLDIGTARVRCMLKALRCAALSGARGAIPGDAVSPDGRRAAFVRDHDLWLRDLASGIERRLTFDGAEHRAYARPTERAAGILTGLPIPRDLPAAVIWSPDSRRLVTVRVDETALPEFSLVEQVPRDRLLPRVHRFRYGFAVEPGEAREALFVVEADSGRVVPIDVPAEPLGFDSTIFMRRAWWSADGTQLALAIAPVDERRIDLYRVDPATGAARRVLREQAERRVLIAGELQYPPPVALLAGGDVIWYSTRDGIGRLYRVDGETGAIRHPLSGASSSVHRMLHLDEARGWLYFLAGGDTVGAEPYLANVWRVRLDGSRLTRLTPEPADHQVVTQFIGLGAPPSTQIQGFAPDGSHFVDTYSTPLDPEVTVLRRADGRLVAELARAGLSTVVASRYRPPERFVVQAPEGREALHGLLLFPSDFDPRRSYPVIDAIYNGSQVVEHPRRFARAVFGEAQSLAELGFVVVVMDARGTPLRSQAFLDFSTAHPDQVAMIGDHVHALRVLARTRPYLDLDRVGLAGTSNGGYAVVRGLFAFPEFFKVGVAANGSHDLRKYIATASGLPPGVDPMEGLRPRANQEFASSFRGKLLMIVGGFDTNVPVASSYGVAQALIDAGKDFDMVVVPRMGHDMSFDAFAIRKQWDFFVRHLQGGETPGDYRMPAFDVAER